MKRVFARLATIAVALPFAVGAVAMGAHAGEVARVTVPGCWGAGDDSTIVCNLTLVAEATVPEVEIIYVRVCTGTCRDIPVQWIDPDDADGDICYSYTDGAGNPRSGCLVDGIAVTPGITPTILQIFRCDGTTDVCAHQ